MQNNEKTFYIAVDGDVHSHRIATSNGGVQIGLLNYNENALIKWMPLVNFSFGGKEK